MFDISFGKLLLIGIVALVVLGPERLPTVARTLGALLARAQRFVANVKADIQQQANVSGLHELKQELQDTAEAFKNKLENEVQSVREVVDTHSAEVQALVEEAGLPMQQAAQQLQDGLQTDSQAQEAASSPLVEPSPTIKSSPLVEVEPVNLHSDQPDLFASPAVTTEHAPAAPVDTSKA